MVKTLLLAAILAHICVLASSTGAPVRCKRKNEVFDPCPSCPARTCGINDSAVSYAPALPFGNPKCPPPSCRCKNGFYRNNVGNCVRWNKCPTCRKPNQVYDPCPAPCPPRTCDVDEALILCQVPPQLGDPECKPACRCRDGYVKNQTGVCIPKDKCPTSCNGDPNAVSGCGIYCNQRCRDIGKEPGACILLCKINSCDCRKGYYLDENTGKCVLPRQCTPQCPVNEFYSTCIQGNCSPQNCSEVDSLLPCRRIDPRYCKKGCLCQEGYVRNDKGVCIPSSDCRPQCPINEFYSTCIQGNCRPQTCSEVNSSLPCPRIDPRFCKKGCLCQEGYVRNDKGVCILSSDCPTSCNGDSNAVPGCGIYCNQRCRDVGKEPGACILLCKTNSCDCRKGYYLDENTGKCVLPRQCTPQCPVNEFYSTCIQGNCSPQTCSEIVSPLPCRRIDPRFCKKGCLCQEGYVRNDKGVCIPSSDCLPACGGDSNKVPGCGVYCNQRCSDIGNEPRFCTEVCFEDACDCREGYYLDDNTGLCVLPKECTPTCPLNEVYSECTNGGCQARNCSQYGKEVPCIKIDPKFCIKGCVCKDSYLRTSNGQCVPKEDCREACNGPNEEYSECSFNCPPQTCDSLDRVYNCPIKEGDNCRPTCRCKSGYFRNKIGECITEEECRRCSGPNEFYSCGGACDNVCATLDEQSQDNCQIRNIKCNEMCYCEKDYARARNNTCIPISSCDTPTCPLNEVYSECTNGGCQARNCSQYGKEVPCIKIDPKFCIKGCVCKDSYLRTSNGQCVPKEDCREACNGPNEEYSECSFNCPPQTCDSLDRVYNCPIKEGDNCRPTCRCKSGYFRNKIGECITEEECRRCSGPNEFYSCGGACDNVCATLDEQSQDNCQIRNIKCNEMCYCEKDYARARNNTCIPISSCDTPQCPLNERYENCPGSNCEPVYCDDIGYSATCPPQPDDGSCSTKPGCVCVDEYVRDKDGKCIPRDQCPSCGDDPNARPGCGVNCGKRCSDLIRLSPCPRICRVNACDCKDGFYYDSNQNKCVLAGQCTGICGKNEVFEDCSNPVCSAKNCSQVGFPLDCNETCVKGCVCQNGYVRNTKGICIPIKQCPSCGGDSNAQSGCGTNCLKRCPNNKINPKLCPRIACVPQLNRCDCKDGFYYDINTENCVKLEECSPGCDDSNYEVYDSCTNGGCELKNCSQVGGPKLCIDPIKCYKGCKCKEGYYRLDNGTCVPEEQCPKYPRCNDLNNEVYDPCPPICPPETCESIGKIYNCPKMDVNPTDCKGQCRCKPNYYRNKIGECVNKEDCSYDESSSSEGD